MERESLLIDALSNLEKAFGTSASSSRQKTGESYGSLGEIRKCFSSKAENQVYGNLDVE